MWVCHYGTPISYVVFSPIFCKYIQVNTCSKHYKIEENNMAEQKQPRNYISVDLERESDEQVKFTNQKNEFTGKLMSVNNATDKAEDVRNIFVQDVKVNDVI